MDSKTRGTEGDASGWPVGRDPRRMTPDELQAIIDRTWPND
jgi:hypothetical protein